MDALIVFVYLLGMAWGAWLVWFINLIRSERQAPPPPAIIHIPTCPHERIMFQQTESGHLHWWCTTCGWQRWSCAPFVSSWSPPTATACGCPTCQENGCVGWCGCKACHQGICDG